MGGHQKPNVENLFTELSDFERKGVDISLDGLAFFFFLVYFISLIAAWAAASRAIGTRNGEQLT